jgi:hypothetical protein
MADEEFKTSIKLHHIPLSISKKLMNAQLSFGLKSTLHLKPEPHTQAL